jgi:hypothetical protein
MKMTHQTYRWWDFGDGRDEEINDTLTGGNYCKFVGFGEYHGSLNQQPPHLFPKQPSHTKLSSTSIPDPKQTNEHDEK